MAPLMNDESDIVWEKMHGKLTSIHCGGPRKVASHRMPASSLRLVSVVLTSFKDQHCDFTTIG